MALSGSLLAKAGNLGVDYRLQYSDVHCRRPLAHREPRSDCETLRTIGNDAPRRIECQSLMRCNALSHVCLAGSFVSAEVSGVTST